MNDKEHANIWKSAVMGVVVGDALGCPVQFESREEVKQHPVTGMRGYGTFHLPEGSWTDDSSLTLAALDSIREKKTLDFEDMMDRFVQWLFEGAYTPFGESFDIGRSCHNAIAHYKRGKKKAVQCGGCGEHENGNGSLMRIIPICLYAYLEQKEHGLSDNEAICLIHDGGSLTHGHIRANIACGLYYFMIRAILKAESGKGPGQILQAGLNDGFAFYQGFLGDKENLEYYNRLRDLSAFALLPEDDIRSSGYVVDSLEAAVWCLLNTDSFEAALLKAVNLGDDTDTVGAIAGGLAGLYYGYDAIPAEWLEAIQKREWVESLCSPCEGV